MTRTMVIFELVLSSFYSELYKDDIISQQSTKAIELNYAVGSNFASRLLAENYFAIHHPDPSKGKMLTRENLAKPTWVSSNIRELL